MEKLTPIEKEEEDSMPKSISSQIKRMEKHMKRARKYQREVRQQIEEMQQLGSDFLKNQKCQAMGNTRTLLGQTPTSSSSES
ncbi:uncharacterized protein LOC117896909 isoform X2 [Drosophila subobscura]|uniref:uncharacterized protein LOC117896909 isoform X2 n=1 Tax=Drosophila subobscura TaxID=7241 RepID=UPI00155A6FFD|nr:uncharacterized protein LOC117896909 isoform X2 [Drosophila subobscura]